MRPNFLIVITDLQRAPRHWPGEPGWLDALMPADAELRRTGLTFTEARRYVDPAGARASG